jgi:hypothetical protein
MQKPPDPDRLCALIAALLKASGATPASGTLPA